MVWGQTRELKGYVKPEDELKNLILYFSSDS